MGSSCCVLFISLLLISAVATLYLKSEETPSTAKIAVVIVAATTVSFYILLYKFCRCVSSVNSIETDDCDNDDTSLAMSPQNQAPMENINLEDSIGLAVDDSNNAEFIVQSGSGYQDAAQMQSHPGKMPNSDRVNMGYKENSYFLTREQLQLHNSQDSLRQMKMAAANNPIIYQIEAERHNYGYDPVTQSGSRINYDSDPDQHMQPTPRCNNMRGMQTPPRQEYCSKPYASVHKPKKCMDSQINSPYHEVSGLPEVYGAGDDDGDGDGEDSTQSRTDSMSRSSRDEYSTPRDRWRLYIINDKVWLESL